MNRRRIFFTGILLAGVAVLAAAIWLWLRFQPDQRLFIRLDIASSLHDSKVVSVDPRTGEIKWRGKRRAQRNKVSGIGGAGFALEGERSFSFTVPWRGNCGFFCYYDFRSNNGQPVAMDLRLLRSGSHRSVGGVAFPNKTGYFIQKVDVRSGDRFELNWRGHGRVFIGRPLLYRIVPVSERKTIVMLAADTLRGDQIDASVGNVAVAPFLAAFSKACARFSHCLSPGTWTLPSFASLFTARSEIVHGLNTRTTLAADQPFLVEALADSHITVNFHGGIFMQLQAGFHRGFDIVQEGGYFAERKSVMAKSLLEGTLAMLKAAEFPAVFLFLHTYQVHLPYIPYPDLLRRLDPANPCLVSGNYFIDTPSMASTASDKEHYFRLYQAVVSVLDREIERFISGLKQMGIYERTMFILFGDHGDAFGEHGLWDHGHSMYEEIIHVPLLIRFPAGQFAGKNVAQPVSLKDLFPTLLDWLDIPGPKAPLDGVSLMPSLRSGAKRPEPIISSMMNAWISKDIPAMLALSFSRYKIIVTFARDKNETEKVRVFDLSSDPQEMMPLTAIPPAEWRLSLPIIRQHREYLKRPRKDTGRSWGKDLGPEFREQLEQIKAMGYL